LRTGPGRNEVWISFSLEGDHVDHVTAIRLYRRAAAPDSYPVRTIDPGLQAARLAVVAVVVAIPADDADE
jgi:hypothetical protein